MLSSLAAVWECLQLSVTTTEQQRTGRDAAVSRNQAALEENTVQLKNTAFIQNLKEFKNHTIMKV